MSVKKYNIEDRKLEVTKKWPWYYAPIFAAFWLIIFLALVNTQVNHLPEPLTRQDEKSQPHAFIAQRAQETLIGLTSIGPRVVGSVANEITTVDFLKQQIYEIQKEAKDFMRFEIDVQQVSGAYVIGNMINMYQGVQNVVVKLSRNDTTNENYLLINSHFDSVPYSPGAGDDGSMVVTMLEVLRILGKSDEPLKNPIIFLFNGAEENPLQASHGFITQHKWAKNCKALINLDAAGNGGREILFQSGPNHPWLMNYYRKVPHPFANTLGEELFQGGYIPSDTDFRIFRDFGGVPGLDMAYIFNGYVYHTKFDRINVLPAASLQHTGDNVLALAKGLANSPEIDDSEKYAEGHNVFYDYLGWFMVFYTKTTSIIINCVVCVVALITIGISLYFMSTCSNISWKDIAGRYGITFAIQILSIALACGLTLLVAVFMDGVGKSLTWFGNRWLIAGLYCFPIFFGLGILPAIYLEYTKTDDLSLGFRVQLFMHSQCLFLILVTIITTAVGIRSSYMFMVCVLFDIISLIINLITKWHRKGYWFAYAVIICQIFPFAYIVYLTEAALLTLIPMQGRSGSSANPELTIAGLSMIFSILFSGFIIPIFMLFRKTRTIICCFLAGTILFIIIAVTPAGFPYTAETAVQRYSLIHVHRRLNNADGTSRIDEPGIYIFPQDRRFQIAEEFINKIGETHRVSEFCGVEMFCGMPLYNYRWHNEREHSYWVKTNDYPLIPTDYPKLELVEMVSLESDARRRFSFTLSGPDHMNIFIDVKNNAKVVDWTFNETFIRDNHVPPYFIYFSYGIDNSALSFSIDVEKTGANFDTTTLEIGIAGHWIHEKSWRSQASQSFVDKFPEYIYIQDWIGTYESWYF